MSNAILSINQAVAIWSLTPRMKAGLEAILGMIRSTASSAEGIRAGSDGVGSPQDKTLKLCIIVLAELTDPDWPDEFAGQTGAFIYYGEQQETRARTA